MIYLGVAIHVDGFSNEFKKIVVQVAEIVEDARWVRTAVFSFLRDDMQQAGRGGYAHVNVQAVGYGLA